MGKRTICLYGAFHAISLSIQPLRCAQTFPLSDVLIRKYASATRPYWMCLDDQMVMFKHICSYVFGYEAPHVTPLPRILGPLARPASAWELILQRFPNYQDPNFPRSLPDDYNVRQRIRLILSDDFRCQLYERVRAQTAASAASWGKERIEKKVNQTGH